MLCLGTCFTDVSIGPQDSKHKNSWPIAAPVLCKIICSLWGLDNGEAAAVI